MNTTIRQTIGDELLPDVELQGGRYRIIRSLGRGGFGITYLAEQVLAKRKVCIKEFFPKGYYKREDTLRISLSSDSFGYMSKMRDKFVKEAQTIARLDHPNIIHIHDVFEENDTAYYVMDYIDGCELSTMIARDGALVESRAVDYIRQVGSALSHIHSQKIMHLDVKPANIMVRKSDNCAILIDFGLSKQYDEGGNQTSSTPIGQTPGFAPAEQSVVGGVKDFSPTTDIYSLGATLYALVTAQMPPLYSELEMGDLPAMPDGVSRECDTAIRLAMQYLRRNRPQSVDEFLSLLDTKPKPPTPKKSSKAWLWITLAVLLVVGCVGGWYLYDQNQEKARVEAEQKAQEEAARIAEEKRIAEQKAEQQRIAEQKAQEEAARIAEEKRIAEQKAEQQRIAEQKVQEEAARIAEEKRIAEQKAEQERKKQEEAKRAEERRVAEERAKKEAEVKRIAEEKAKARGIIQGHEYVDLGLSVLWATCNIGASYPFERGDYFSWGEVETKSNFSHENYKYDKKDVRNIGKNISSSSYDAATKKWGKNWRIPTLVEMKELMNNCLWEETTLQGCKGYKITGKNGKYIFLPATGMDLGPGHGLVGPSGCFYWTATLSEEYDFNAYCLRRNEIDDPSRSYGLCIRPVSNISNAKQTVSYDDLVSDEAKNSAPTFGLR